MITSAFKILSALSFRKFHTTTSGRIVRINAEDIFELSQSLIIVTNLYRTTSEKESLLNFTDIFNMLWRQGWRPAIWII